MDFSELFQEGTTVQGPDAASAGPGAVDLTQQGNFSSMMTPVPEIEKARVPAATPAEAAKRKVGWQRVMEAFQNNPNLQRAMMLVGAQLAQPIAPGQTRSGHMANSAVVGLNAYQQGQQQEQAQSMALKREAREEQRLGIEQERLEEAKKMGVSQRETAQVGRQETLLDIKTKQEGMEDKIKQGRAIAEKAVLDLEEFKDGASLRKAERALKEQEARIRAEIPDEVRMQAELDKVNELRAKIDQARATTQKTTAEARILEEDLALGPKGRAELKAPASQTAVGARWKLMSEAYDASENLRRQYPDKNAWLVSIETDAKTSKTAALKAVNDAINLLPMVKPGKPDPAREKLMQQQQILINELVGAPATGAPATAAPPAEPSKKGGEGLPQPKSKAERDALPSTVEWYLAPDGSRRRNPNYGK